LVFKGITRLRAINWVLVFMMWIKILFVLFSLIITRADITKGAVPRLAFIFAFPFFFMLKLMRERNDVLESLIGVLIGLIVFLFVHIITSRKLGLADVWYSALIGLVLGPWWWHAAIGLACVTGVIYILISKQRLIPFIPFMALGSAVIYYFQG
jgi:hypothetical protein